MCYASFSASKSLRDTLALPFVLLLCVMVLIYMCDGPHLYVCNASLICVICHIPICASFSVGMCVYIYMYLCMYTYIFYIHVSVSMRVCHHVTSCRCNTLQHTATHCNVAPRDTLPLQRTATHCNTLQHTAPHCTT